MTLTPAQIDVLLRPINPARVSVLDGLSHLEAYDVRAHLIRCFGFTGWSGDVLDMTLLYEQETTTKANKPAFKVAYRCTYRLTVAGATYTEVAVGEALMPDFKRGDAHDMAAKTAESQALKRCAVNLGDQFGLSLYAKGSREALVKRTLVGAEITEPVDAGVAPVIPEHAQYPDSAEPATDSPPVAAPVEQPSPLAAPGDTGSPAASIPVGEPVDRVATLRAQAFEAVNTLKSTDALHSLMQINLTAGREKLLRSPCKRENGEDSTLGLVVDELVKKISRSEP